MLEIVHNFKQRIIITFESKFQKFHFNHDEFDQPNNRSLTKYHCIEPIRKCKYHITNMFYDSNDFFNIEFTQGLCFI